MTRALHLFFGFGQFGFSVIASSSEVTMSRLFNSLPWGWVGEGKQGCWKKKQKKKQKQKELGKKERNPRNRRPNPRQIPRRILGPEDRPPADTADAPESDKHRRAEGALPLAADVVGLVGECGGDIGVCARGDEEDAEVACGWRRGEAH